MLKMLKTDFYKIIKSKMLLAFFIVTLAFSLLNPILHAVNGSHFSVYYNLRQPGLLYGILWIFVVPFVSKDFSSGYMKNLSPVYSQKDRFYYILSKVVYIFAFCVLFMLLNFVFEIIFNFIAGKQVMYDDTNFTIGEFYLHYICSTLNSVAIGTVIMFLCVLVKKEYIVLIIILPYIYFLSHLIFDAIDRAVGGNFRLELYTVFGLDSALFSSKKDDLIIGIVLSLVYSLVFTVGSWLIFRKRSF